MFIIVVIEKVSVISSQVLLVDCNCQCVANCPLFVSVVQWYGKVERRMSKDAVCRADTQHAKLCFRIYCSTKHNNCGVVWQQR